nr:hypothetical protein I302_02651 [Kwoniella bestiolae CBS 10118]OCF27802.1 hypothetical protein I302_02651 [Kwoniella bestiolae CBS 10118]
MFEICERPTSTNDEAGPIDLEFSSDIIEVYLDIISSSVSPHLLQVNYYELKPVYELCSFTMSTEALSTVRDMLVVFADEAGEPWDLLNFASEHNDISLAKSTFVLCGPNEVSDILEGCPDEPSIKKAETKNCSSGTSISDHLGKSLYSMPFFSHQQSKQNEIRT